MLAGDLAQRLESMALFHHMANPISPDEPYLITDNPVKALQAQPLHEGTPDAEPTNLERVFHC